MEQVHVLHRRKSLDLEVRESPYVKSLAHHGVKPAIEPFFLVTVLTWAIGEVLGACYTQALARGAHGNNDSPEVAGIVCLVQYRTYSLLGCLGLAQQVRPPEVEIDDDIVLFRELPDKAGHGSGCCVEIFIPGECRHADDARALVNVSCLRKRLPINHRAFEVL